MTDCYVLMILTLCSLSSALPGNSRSQKSICLTSMMTPQMLITIPHAAIFGPQNRSDGMSASAAYTSDSCNKRTTFIKKDGGPTDPHGQLIHITRVSSGDFDPRRDRDAHSKVMKWKWRTFHASSASADQWCSTSKVAQDSLYSGGFLCCSTFILFLMWFINQLKYNQAQNRTCIWQLFLFCFCFFISSSSQWKPAKNSTLANVTGANFS